MSQNNFSNNSNNNANMANAINDNANTVFEPLENSYGGLNRNLDCPSYSQIPVKYSQQLDYDHQIELPVDYSCLQKELLVIDSSDRSNNKETPGCYTVYLNRSLKNVFSIELVGGKLPNPCYNVTTCNNRLVFQETREEVGQCRSKSVFLTPGDYSALTLANKLQDAMNEVGKNHYTVTVDNITKIFNIKSDNANGENVFNLIFTDAEEFTENSAFIDREVSGITCSKQRIKFDVKDQRIGQTRRLYIQKSIGRLLGFPPKNYCGQLNYSAEHCYNLNPFDYVAIFINDYGIVRSVNNKIDGAFCVIPLDSTTNTFDVNTRDVDNIRHLRHFYPLEHEISKLSIKFITNTGEIFDFNGQDNVLILEIGTTSGQPIYKGAPIRGRV